MDWLGFDTTWALRAVDLLFVALIAEAAVLAVWKRARAARWVWMLLSGAALVAALHAALVQAPMAVLMVCLLASGLCHALDLMQRWRWREQHRRPPGALSS